MCCAPWTSSTPAASSALSASALAASCSSYAAVFVSARACVCRCVCVRVCVDASMCCAWAVAGVRVPAWRSTCRVSCRHRGTRSAQVHGQSAADTYVVFAKHYCSCHAFLYDVVVRGDMCLVRRGTPHTAPGGAPVGLLCIDWFHIFGTRKGSTGVSAKTHSSRNFVCLGARPTLRPSCNRLLTRSASISWPCCLPPSCGAAMWHTCPTTCWRRCSSPLSHCYQRCVQLLM